VIFHGSASRTTPNPTLHAEIRPVQPPFWCTLQRRLAIVPPSISFTVKRHWRSSRWSPPYSAEAWKLTLGGGDKSAPCEDVNEQRLAGALCVPVCVRCVTEGKRWSYRLAYSSIYDALIVARAAGRLHMDNVTRNMTDALWRLHVHIMRSRQSLSGDRLKVSRAVDAHFNPWCLRAHRLALSWAQQSALIQSTDAIRNQGHSCVTVIIPQYCYY